MSEWVQVVRGLHCARGATSAGASLRLTLIGARRRRKGFSNSLASFGKRVRPHTKPTKRERSACEKLSSVRQKICVGRGQYVDEETRARA